MICPLDLRSKCSKAPLLLLSSALLRPKYSSPITSLARPKYSSQSHPRLLLLRHRRLLLLSHHGLLLLHHGLLLNHHRLLLLHHRLLLDHHRLLYGSVRRLCNYDLLRLPSAGPGPVVIDTLARSKACLCGVCGCLDAIAADDDGSNLDD